ncbi:MAG: hypothetical protein RR475_02365 [Clostridia bacterium]
MLKLEETIVFGFEPAIRGMRNPKNSWEKSDSQILGSAIRYDEDNKRWEDRGYEIKIGPNDLQLMKSLASGGPVHAKYRRMIVVYVDITAPLYWWKEFDTYRVGVTPNPTDIEINSCSTMHKIQAKEFTLEDFSTEHLIRNWNGDNGDSVAYVKNPLGVDEFAFTPFEILRATINALNTNRDAYLNVTEHLKNDMDRETMLKLQSKQKGYWWQMIQLLPTSYNQKRTIMLNYEVLAGIYPMRKDHKLYEWHTFCEWIEQLPYAKDIIIGDEAHFHE